MNYFTLLSLDVSLFSGFIFVLPHLLTELVAFWFSVQSQKKLYK